MYCITLKGDANRQPPKGGCLRFCLRKADASQGRTASEGGEPLKVAEIAPISLREIRGHTAKAHTEEKGQDPFLNNLTP